MEIRYRRKTANRFVMLWDEWKPVELFHRDAWRGTYRMFGFRSWLCIASPLANKIIHWKNRHKHLVVPYSTRDTLSVIPGDKP